MADVSTLFIRVLNLTGLLLFAWMLPIANQVWGMDYFVILDTRFEGIKAWAMLLNLDAMRAHYEWFLYPCMLLMALAAFGYTHSILRFITWALFVNLHFANYEVSNGGWHILHHLFLLSIFLIPVQPSDESRKAALFRLLHHLGFYFIWVQIAILYCTAGYHKFLGTAWPNGDALMIALALDEFTLPWLQRNMIENSWYLKLGTWITFLYQISFPILIWVKKVRPWLLFVGLVFHLSVTFLVGVSDFGLILVAVYIIYIPADKAAQILELFSLRFLRKKMAGMRSINGTGD